MSHDAMGFAVEKVKSTGNNNIWICERGNSFGYQDLIVDATAITKLKKHKVPVIMDCTHAFKNLIKILVLLGVIPHLYLLLFLVPLPIMLMDFSLKHILNQKKLKSDPFTMLKLDSLYSILKKAMRIREAIN